MGHVARCYKIFFHKDLSMSSLFYDNFILEIWASKSLFSINERFPSKNSYLIYISKFNHQIFEQLSHLISICHNIILPLSHKGHYIKVYWVHLIILDWTSVITFKKSITNWIPKIWPWNFNIVFWCMNSFLTWIPFHHLHISIGINYYWNF